MKKTLPLLLSCLLLPLAAHAGPGKFVEILAGLKDKPAIARSPTQGFEQVKIESTGADYVCFSFVELGFVRCYPITSVIWVNQKGAESAAPTAIMLSDI